MSLTSLTKLKPKTYLLLAEEDQYFYAIVYKDQKKYIYKPKFIRGQI